MATMAPTKLKLAKSKPAQGKKPAEPWKVLIVDDDEEVHAVTKLALKGYEFSGRPVHFFHAYSGGEAVEIMAREQESIALILLDVVMEEDHAGLDVVTRVRDDFGNHITRIVLRTGQPGQAPESKIIMDYDINDYKEKTDLTTQKLFTLLSASLRGYRDLVALEESRQGLRKIIDASAGLFSMTSMQQFAQGALEQLLSLLYINKPQSFYGRAVDSAAAMKRGANFEIMAGTGRYQCEPQARQAVAALPEHILQDIRKTDNATSSKVIRDNELVSYHRGRSGHENILYVGGDLSTTKINPDLFELYVRNVGIAFENIDLQRQIEDTQRELVFRLGEAVETRSSETGNHLKRVAELCRLLGTHMGLDSQEVEILTFASPLHDVGKIGIPDSILNKPGKLDAEEWSIMKTHSEIGHRLFEGSDKPILKAGGIIALDHHEKWNGTGYPYGKRGEEIHIFGRIVGVADVYDALNSKRCYKPAWSVEEVFAYMREQRGLHFQPDLIDCLCDIRAEVEEAMRPYNDCPQAA